MSLYRIWRPKTFADLVGQDAVVRTLTSALESGKLAHAYLFSGPRGSGKTSAAKILARCINCVNGPTATPDNTCENCLAILAGTALDVLEIDAASNRGIDEIRALREAVKFAPSAMRMKVYIVDEAHMLTKEGANAFLKTLEEPPAHAVFILATTEPERLPVTILSRCQRYAFRRIAIPVMIDRMREISAAEGIVIDEAALSAIAYRADGGLRDALTMLEQASAFAGGPVTAETIDVAFGATGRNYAEGLMDAIRAGDASAALARIDDAAEAGTDMQVMTRGLIAQFRNLLVAQIDPELLARDLASEDAQRARERSQHFAQPQIVRALTLLSEASAAARYSAHPRLDLETAVLRYLLEGNARFSAAPAAPPPAAKPPAPAPAQKERPAAGPVTLQRVRAAWQSIRTKVESEKQPLKVQLSRAVPESVSEGSLTIKLPNQMMAQTLKEHAALIDAAVAEVLGAPLKTRFIVDGGAAAPRGGPSAPATDATLSAEPADDPDELFSYLNERIK